MFGKLTWDAIPLHEPIIMYTLAVVGLLGLAVVGAITYMGKWKYLWQEWFTSVDHKRIGVMYIVVALVMLLRGFADALMMRTQQAMASDGSPGYLPPEHYDQIFTAHGVIMIFFMAMPFVVGLMNVVVPLQIGARDVAYPFLNAVSFWLFVSGAVLVNLSLGIGEFARTGWVAYPPLSGIGYSPGVGVDYYIWALQISGVGTLLTGLNFFVTILKMRTTGMTLFRMPVFTWTVLCTSILILAAFPILTATLFMLTLDRYLGMHFFTNELGGNPMMYVNLIWAWGHPEVYILILPAFGIFSEVASTFSRKKLFGYYSHNVIIGGAVFGYLCGLTYWFPKAFGFKLHDPLGRAAFWCWLAGFYFAFMPSYFLGFMGMTRRLNHFDVPEWRPFLLLEMVGVLIILCGVACQVMQLVVSIRKRHENRDTTGDPWDGRTLEWATASPPPFYNFAEQPVVGGIDAYWGMKEKGVKTLAEMDFRKIHMPHNTSLGLVLGVLSTVLGFALIWHIWWLVIASSLAVIATLIVRSYDPNTDYCIPAEAVERMETERRQRLAEA
ncbi:cbb3-type cytochrome c oxidase subunit I [Pseudomonas fulva]|uniref:cbb3-type cytochrome c oxidase subunit I n=1 Tax=Pseudomonas TaxID=286 RepID=UPI00119E68D2|nr:cbb3-type cytochrome c oxidase subunit I [Pseudomonas sp. URMO17WK12:I11]